jgi:hypothetical protein
MNAAYHKKHHTVRILCHFPDFLTACWSGVRNKNGELAGREIVIITVERPLPETKYLAL